ncbi:MAG: CHAD domain-containing protein [Rhodopirellula sp. JB044]|uniref:CHAD domain-containing protein n=1 Tax=Rhodopirellula sp. JB044 TaxID=3342844 RepID=UPI00370B782D
MSFKLKQTEKVQSGVRRIATEQIDKAIREVEDDSLPRHEVIHQVRKRCKKVRGLVRLVRPALGKAYHEANVLFRDAARPLSELRDAKSMVGTCDDLMNYFEGKVDRSIFESIRSSLKQDLSDINDRKIGERLSEFRDTMLESKKMVKDWALSDSGFDAIEGGFIKTYERASDRLSDAKDDRDSHLLHQFRKRTKYHWYHLRLLQDIWPPIMKSYRDAAKELSDLLGDEHDYAVLRQTILNDPEVLNEHKNVEVFVALLDARRRRLANRAITIAERLFASSGDVAAGRIEKIWDVWRTKTV